MCGIMASKKMSENLRKIVSLLSKVILCKLPWYTGSAISNYRPVLSFVMRLFIYALTHLFYFDVNFISFFLLFQIYLVYSDVC